MTKNWIKHVSSLSNPKTKYKLIHQDGVYSCSCIAWKKQYTSITKRTCKHLRKELGDARERKRAPESFSGHSKKLPKGRTVFSFGLPWKKPMLFNTIKDREVAKPDWFYSVKLNGAFGRIHNGKLYTKRGRQLHPPQAMLDKFPEHIDFDVEIYHKTMQNVRLALSDVWSRNPVKLIAYDLVSPHPFSQRLKDLEDWQKDSRFKYNIVHYKRVLGQHNLRTMMKKVIDNGDEGLVLRDPKGKYDGSKRSSTTLKWKPWFQGKCIIMEKIKKKKGYTIAVTTVKAVGKGRHHFNIYTSDSLAKDITVKSKKTFYFSGRHDNGTPELATFRKPLNSSSAQSP